jgi:hypothetical protein
MRKLKGINRGIAGKGIKRGKRDKTREKGQNRIKWKLLLTLKRPFERNIKIAFLRL